MSRLLVVEESTILCGIFKKLLDKEKLFTFDIVQNYKDAQEHLNKYEYEFAVVSRTLPDASHGEIIALVNKHDIPPIVYATEIDEEFMESFESARIVEYILRHRYDNVKYVVARLKQLEENKKRTVLVAHKSEIYRRYLKQNLLLHNFNVILVKSAYEAIQKFEVYSDIDILIVNNELEQVSGLEDINGLELVRRVRKMHHDNLNIIAIAVETNSHLTRYFLNEGADDYLLSQHSRSEFYVRIYQNLKNRE
jgi:putative two-component system response regulator